MNLYPKELTLACVPFGLGIVEVVGSDKMLYTKSPLEWTRGRHRQGPILHQKGDHEFTTGDDASYPLPPMLVQLGPACSLNSRDSNIDCHLCAEAGSKLDREVDWQFRD